MGVAVASVAAYIAYAVATMGLGTLLGSVSGVIASTVASQVFGIGLTAFNVGAGFSMGWALTDVANAFLNWLASLGLVDPGFETLLAAIIGAVLGLGSTIAALFTAAMADPSASTATVAGLFFGILSLALLFGVAMGGVIGKALSFISGMFGFLGVFFSTVGITKARFLYQIVNGAGLAMGALGAYLGIKYGTS
jgi:hypothetical protein